jgi:hypothetical protein
VARKPIKIRKLKAGWNGDPTQDPLYPFPNKKQPPPEDELPEPEEELPPPKRKESWGSLKKRYR